MINHCDRPITLLSATDTVDRHSIINHCDRPITLLGDTDTVVITVMYHAMSLTTVSVSPRRVISLSQ
jgi:hypothetical protein